MADTIKKFGVAPAFSLVTAATLDPSNVVANSVSVETFTVKGLKTNMCVFVNAPNLETGVKIISQRVTATDTLELTFWNLTGLDVDPVSQHFFVVAF